MNSNRNDSNHMGWAEILAGKVPKQYQKEQFEGKSKKQLIEQYNKNIYAIQDYKEDIARKTEKLTRTFDASHYGTTMVITLFFMGGGTLLVGGKRLLMSLLYEAADLPNPKSLKKPKNFFIKKLIKKSGDLYIPLLINSKIFGITQLKDHIQSHRKENEMLREIIESDEYKMKFIKNLRIPRKNPFI